MLNTKFDGKYAKLTLPAVTIFAPFLSRRDTKRKHSDGKFKVSCLLPKDEAWVKEFEELCYVVADEEWPASDNLREKVRISWKDGDTITDSLGKQHREFVGYYLLTPRSPRPVVVVDNKLNEIKPYRVSAWDTVKVQITLNPCVVSKTQTIDFWLNSVQKLQSYRPSFDPDAFEIEEDYSSSSNAKQEEATQTDF